MHESFRDPATAPADQQPEVFRKIRDQIAVGCVRLCAAKLRKPPSPRYLEYWPQEDVLSKHRCCGNSLTRTRGEPKIVRYNKKRRFHLYELTWVRGRDCAETKSRFNSLTVQAPSLIAAFNFFRVFGEKLVAFEGTPQISEQQLVIER